VGTIRDNLKIWNETWDWSAGGQEWSHGWGGTPALWHALLLPRIHQWLPAGTILEIAPGFGRWTAYLKDVATRLIVVDLAPKCIQACRERFAGEQHIEYHVNDGRSLSMVRDESVDFVFSFDSLVHADADAVEGYVAELGRVLTRDGVAFIHHSDVGGFHPVELRLAELVARWIPFMAKTSPRRDWRSLTVSAGLVERLATAAGLQVRSQELLPWHDCPYLTDCFSVITRHGSRWARPNVVIKNRGLNTKTRRASLVVASIYGDRKT
jgi:SAM-dependent methyltransferase